MVTTELHWVERVKPYRLALTARPQGGDALAAEISEWKAQGISMVVSLLEDVEAQELDLLAEAGACKVAGIEFISLPIPDCGVPERQSAVVLRVEQAVARLLEGQAVAVHCRAGIGRSGLFAGCVLRGLGVPFEAILQELSRSRGIAVPETQSQAEFVRRFSLDYTKAF